MENTDKMVSKTKKTSMPKMPSAVKLSFEIPSMSEFLKTGAQFGHQSKRWNPKMGKYIYDKRGDIHIIDLSQTLPLLEQSLKFLVTASQKGRILFVGTKRQAADIIKDEAEKAGAYYVIHRWPGGLFTNFKMISRSLKKLQRLEEDFEEGVEGRTKYEITKMKKEWERLDRLYRGVKTMDRKPRAIVVVDPNYEKNAVREAKAMGVPVIAIVDTNCDPEGINYPIPANDDAVKSLRMLIGLFSQAVKQGNEGKGVVHDNKDYSKFEVKIIRDSQDENTDEIKEITAKTEEKVEKKTEGKEEEKVTAKKESEKPKVETKKKQKKEKKEAKLDELKVSKRTLSALKKASVKVSDLKEMKKEELTDISGVGEKAAEEIISALK